ncbi:MAG: menaquinol-cytochrome c reductase iron-sulfur subunit [Verrucomicrobiales bacterium]|jgi:menaquinol-cytochrome c reductase iron-sulfur subunit
MDEPSSEHIPNESDGPQPDRREFLQKAACVVLGGAATLVPVGAAVTVLVSPMFEKTEGGLKVRLTSLDALPAGGPPQLFKVVSERKDAWTRHDISEIGSVFVQRVGDGTAPEDFHVFSASCPHLGCAVEYLADQGNFSCPCHSSTFAASGEVLNPESPSPRGLDSLVAEVKEGDLWIEYVNFKANIKEKQTVG